MFSALKQSIQEKPSRSEIISNILAGLTVGAIALPLSMALAIASGVPPQHGLYTAMVAGFVIAVTGGSRVNISGPTAAFVVVLQPIVAHYGIGGLLMSGMMAGVILVFMGMARLGKLIEIVPQPVTVGFTAGIAVVIATFQIKDFFGLQIGGLEGDYLEKVSTLAHGFSSVSWTETLIGLLTLSVLLVWPRLKTKVPGHLVALVVGGVSAWALTHFASGFSVATIGDRFHYVTSDGGVGNGIPSILPAFDWPWNLPGADGEPIGMSFELFRQLLPSALTIAMLGALESLLCAVVADGMSGKKHRPNEELIGQGVGNMLVPLFGGIPATAAIARTAANIKAGGTMPLASVVHSAFILVSILALSPLLAYIPMASMAALLLVVAWNMSEAKHFVRTVKVAPRNDIGVLVICFSLTVLFDMTVAVAVGMGLAAVLFIKRSINLSTAEVKMGEVELSGLSPIAEKVAVYDINGPLFFGSAQKTLRKVSETMEHKQVVVLDMSKVTMLDMSAIVTLEAIVDELSTKKRGLVINNLEPRMIQKLNRAGICQQEGKLVFSRTLSEGYDLCCGMV